MKKLLENIRIKNKNAENDLLNEVKTILRNDLLRKEKVLANLNFYYHSFEVLDDSEIEKEKIFSEKEIENVCMQYRLRFLDSQLFGNEIPYEAVLKIDELNKKFGKDLRGFKILSFTDSYKKGSKKGPFAIFARTGNNHFYLVHSEGKEIGLARKIFAFPLVRFENLAFSTFTLILFITLLLPTKWITFDTEAGYFCRYRVGAFIHLLIFAVSFIAYYFVSFRIRFSETLWNNPKID